MSRRDRSRLAAVVVVLFAVFGVSSLAAAQEQPGPDDELIIEGADVFTTCAACHGPAGAGQAGFPPLAGNPHVEDLAYVEDVIRNGRTGPIEVNGVTYDAEMPAQTGLSDREIEAVIAYIAGGFQLPVGAVVDEGPSGGVGLPAISTGLANLAILAFVVLALWIVGPELVSAVGPRTTWLVAWGKSAIIVVFFVVATVVVPSVAMQTSTVSRLPRIAQDLVGSGLWVLGLAVGLGGLWWAKREKRI